MIERGTWLFFLCCVFFQPVSTFAETRTTRKIVVLLEGCDAVRNASIVLRGDEGGRLELKSADGRWNVERAKSFDASTVTASLRLHPGRTTCRRALPEREDESGKPIAMFVFRCTAGEYHRIALDQNDESVPLAYRRDVTKSRIPDDSVPCSESGAFEFGKGTITDVDVNREKIFIYPGFKAPDARWPGILVSELAKPVRGGKVVNKLLPDDLGEVSSTQVVVARKVVKLSREDLVELYFNQAAAGEASGAPVLSDNLRLRVQIALEKRGVTGVDVRVEP